VRGNVKKGLKVTKNPYKIFVVGCGRRDGVWGAFFEGGGIILVPAILLFLPRDAMHKRGLCRHAVCVSVCLSVRHVRGSCQNN